MFKKIMGLIGCFSVLISTAYAAQMPENALIQLLNATHSLQADFTQTILNKAGKPIQTSHGRMAIQRPMQFRWEVISPVQQLMVISQNKLWVYDKDLEQITVRPLKQAAGEIPALLLSDVHPQLNKTFDIQSQFDAAHQAQVFSLKSKRQNSLFATIKLFFKNQLIDQMQLSDFSGQLTVIHFEHLRVNTKLSSQLFHFAPPAGVDVIDETKR